MKFAAAACIIVATIAGSGHGQVNVWPLELGVPVDTAAIDTAVLSIDSRQHLVERSINSKQTVVLRHSDSLTTTIQRVQYELQGDWGLPVYTHYLALPGEWYRRPSFWKNGTLGLDWNPEVVLVDQGRSGGFKGTAELGPTVGFLVRDVPVKIRAGAVGRIWSDRIPENVFKAEFHDSLREPGFYSGIRLGNPTTSVIPHIPLYFHGQGYGRLTTQTAKFAAGDATALLALGTARGDSLFVRVVDSIATGREGFLGDQAYVNIPARTTHAFNGSAAFRGAPRLFVAPGLVYTFSENSIHYPSPLQFTRDDRNRRHSLNALLQTDTLLPLEYSGGILVQWEDDDKAFMQKGSKTGDVLNDSNRADLMDYDGFRAGMAHGLTIANQQGAGIRYSFDVMRYSKRYPHYLLDTARSDTVRIYDDNDWIVEQHRLTVCPYATDIWDVTVGGVFLKNTARYLRRERSGQNAVDRTWRVLAGAGFEPGSRFSVSEEVTAEAKRTEYEFPSVNGDINGDGLPDRPPKYARNITSRLRAQWMPQPRFGVRGSWIETYWDEGYWNGRAYYDTVGKDFREYYAIERKSIDWSVQLAVVCTLFSHIYLETGAEFKDINLREYQASGNTYKENPLGVGRMLTPFVLCRAHWRNRVIFDCRVSYIIHDVLGGITEAPVLNPVADFAELYASIRVLF